MPTPSRFLTAILALFAALPLAAQTGSSPEPGVSHALAIARAERISDLRYNLEYAIHEHDSTLYASEFLTFSSKTAGDLPIDFRDGEIVTAAVNQVSIEPKLVNGHLILPVAAGKNVVSIAFNVKAAASGKAITRYTDKDDGKEYFYTLFVPMDASMAFPCFDQPDLKARFTLRVDHPHGWAVIANTAASGTESSVPDERTSFPETRPISTYLFAFTAGPWQQLPGKAAGEPAIYVRASQLKRAIPEAPEVQQMAARGIAWLSDYFQQPFPFAKYDLVLIPGFPFGGMEHAGATFLNEDGVLFRTAPTQSDSFRRDILVLHETTHQWFGDLVTMRWFDDLWLKEGFAQYMAYKAMAALKPETNPWKHFYEDIKPLAYAIDETQGTTPIYQNIPNLKDAKSAYGAIVYQKAPAVLKQLNFFLGEENFRDGLRLYLKQHAYANAQWADLVAAFEQASQTNKQPKDVQTWAKAWILQRGMPEITAEFTCSGKILQHVVLRQHDVLGTANLWPISTELVFASTPGSQLRTRQPSSHPSQSAQSKSIRVDLTGSSQTVPVAGTACPAYLFANSGDQAYGRFLLDPISEKAVTQSLLLPAESNAQSPLLHTQLWGALWENVRVARTAPIHYVHLGLQTLPAEPDESLDRIQGARIASALHLYLSESGRRAIVAEVERVIADRMLRAETLNLRIVNFRTFTQIAETPAATAQIKALLAGSLTIDGMPLKPLDRWNLVGHLIILNDPEAHQLYLAEKQRDQSGEGQKYAFAVNAGVPSTDTKTAYFDDYLHNASLQEDWITQSLGSFNAWNQSGATFNFLTPALNELPEIKAHRKIFFLGAWLNSFVGGQHSTDAQFAVQRFLAQPNLDPDLRLKVLEVSDNLDRTVRIRQRYPE